MDRIRDTDFNLFAPFDPRAQTHPSLRSEKLSGIYSGPDFPPRVNARISAPDGLTERTDVCRQLSHSAPM